MELRPGDRQIAPLLSVRRNELEARNGSRQRGAGFNSQGQRRIAPSSLWEASGYEPTHSDSDAINSALRPLHESIDGPAAITLALSAADEVDRKVAGLTAELRAALLASGHERALRRSMHRNEHLDDIEQSLT